MEARRRNKACVRPIDDYLKGVQADIHPSVIFGQNVSVWSFCIICQDVVIGDDCAIGSLVYVGRGCKIGNRVRIQDKAHITDRMIIEDDVFIGPCAVTMNDKYPVVFNPEYKPEPPYLEKGCTIGAGAVILPGLRIGAHAMIGAGAVLTKDAAPYSIYTGCPAIKTGELKHGDCL